MATPTLERRPGRRRPAGRAPPKRARRRDLGPAPVTLPVVLYAVLAILILMPVALVVLSAFTATMPRPGNISLTGLTLENFATVFGRAPGRRRSTRWWSGSAPRCWRS